MKRQRWTSTWTLTVMLMAALAPAALSGSDPRRVAPGPSARSLGPFRLGQQVQNRAHLKLRLELGGRGRPQALDVAGDWATTPTDIHDGVVEVQCALANVEASLDANPNPTAAGVASSAAREDLVRAAHELAAALATPFFVSHRADGSIAGLWFSRGVKPTIANLLMTLAESQQLVRSRPGEPAWVVLERDVNGQYTAAYRESGQGRIEKQKARYLAANALTNAVIPGQLAGATGQRLQPSIHIERSDFELRTDPQGRLLEVRGAESIVFALGSPGLEMKTAVEVELGDGRIVEAPRAIGAFARAREGLESRPLEQMGGDPQAEIARRDRAVLDGASFEDLRTALGRLPEDVASGAADLAPLAHRFEALFRLDGAAAARAPALVRGDTPARSKIVVDALSLARTAASQLALAAIAGDASAPNRPRGSALQYLAHQDAPSSDVVDAVAALLDDPAPGLRQMARLTYGAFARSLRPTAAARSRRIVEDVLGRLSRATTADERAELIIALGNAGAPEAWPVLQPLARSGAMRERTRAIESLRFVEDPAVDPFLIEMLRGSEEESVRLAVIGAVRFRDLGPHASVLAEVARHDSAAGVRKAALSVLGDRLSVLPTLRPVLEDIRSSDGVAQNRELAARYLDRTERASPAARARP
jgi:hypothetical protein